MDELEGYFASEETSRPILRELQKRRGAPQKVAEFFSSVEMRSRSYVVPVGALAYTVCAPHLPPTPSSFFFPARSRSALSVTHACSWALPPSQHWILSLLFLLVC